MIEVDVALRRGAFRLDVAFRNAGGTTALFGRSGSGKSTVAELVAGLARPDKGRIAVDGTVLVDTDAGVFLPAHRRRVGIVFQEARLLPHLSVRQNLLFGRFFTPASERTIGIEPVVSTLGIGHLLDRRPAALSGGEKSRVAIGRAVVACPRILVLDEPLAALDRERREEILPLIERLAGTFGLSVLYISHAAEEVARLASHVVVLDHGRVVDAGAPERVLGARAVTEDGPGSLASVVSGRVEAHDEAYGLSTVSTEAGMLVLAGSRGPVGASVRVLIRAADVALATTRPEGISIRTVLTAEVAGLEPAGALVTVRLGLPGGGRLAALTTRKAADELGLVPGKPVFALVKAAAIEAR